MTLEEIIHVFEHSRLVADNFTQEAVTAAYVEALASLHAQLEAKKNGTLKTTWETPETCPRCMEHLSREWSFCPECGRPTDWSKNIPFTLDELREMDGEPVWVESINCPSGWCLVEADGPYNMMVTFYNEWCGKTWRAYRRRPEGGTT